jgi:hypothetical protein
MKFSKVHIPCQQTKNPYKSVGKPTLKCQKQKYRRSLDFISRRAATAHHESVGSTQYPAESVNTFCRFTSVEMVILSIMYLIWGYSYADRTSIP